MSTRSRRRRRHQEHDNAAGGIGLLILFAWLFQKVTSLLWPWQMALAVFTLSVGVLLLYWFIRLRRQRQRRRRLLSEAKHLTPTEFELRVLDLLAFLGWEQVRHAGQAGDQGVDIRGVYRGERCVVQCKRYDGCVGPQYVRDLWGTVHHEHAERGYLITTGYVTAETRTWTRGKPIEIWEGQDLSALFAQQRDAELHPAVERRRTQGTRRLLAPVALINSAVLGWAMFVSDGHFFAASPPQAVPSVRQSAFAPPQAAVDVAAAPPAVPATPVDTCGEAVVAGVDALALREGPGKAAVMMAAIPAGTTVTLLCDAPVTVDAIPWRHVRVGAVEGWMSGRFLR